MEPIDEQEANPLHADLKQLFDDVKAWGRERGINNPGTQLAKLIEEVGEYAHEYTRGNGGNYEKNEFASTDAVDAIGDILITTIILADVAGIVPEEALELAYNAIKPRKGKLMYGGFVKDE